MNPHNQQQPAAAQEAVAWTVVGPDGKSSIGGWQDMKNHDFWQEAGVLREGHRYAYAYAAPVAAAPVDCPDNAEDRLAQAIDERDSAEGALGAMFRAVTGRDPEWSSAWGFGDAIEEAEEHVAALEHKAASTPAAPGIDLAGKSGLLRRARSLFDQDREYALERGDSHHAGQCTKDIASIDALIYANPKGATFPNDGNSEAQFIADGERLNCPACGGSGHVEDSPKGGSEARLRTMVVTLAPLWRLSDSWLAASDSPSAKHRAMWGCAKELRDKLVQMQAQAGDAEVQP